MYTDQASISAFLNAHAADFAAFRQEIHAHPELSNEETNTAGRIIKYLKSLSNPPEIVDNIGGTGFLAIFNFENGAGGDNEKTVVFRSELDAIPVLEKNEFAHVSTNPGVSHKCGHDGHMAILAGLAKLLSDHYRPDSGRVVLLFQPAEEIGAGAQQMVDSPNKVLADIIQSPNSSIFALHNVSGFPAGSIVLPRSRSFASASKGIHIKLGGATSHASQPCCGRNPAPAMCNIIQALLSMPSLYIPYDQKALVTIVGARCGDKSFGVSAGEAEVMATLRATTDTAIEILEEKAKELVAGYAATYHLSHSIAFEDVFSATINDRKSVALVQDVAAKNALDIFEMDEAFPWSEDFGVFLKRIKGAMFGLGSGEKYEPLHGEYYDFPDSQIINGVKMFASIIEQVLKED